MGVHPPVVWIGFTAVIVGGKGNNFGVVVGALLVPVAFNELPRYIPTFGGPGMVEALQWIAIGSLALAFMWFRPNGLFPERRRRMGVRSATGLQADTSADDTVEPVKVGGEG